MPKAVAYSCPAEPRSVGRSDLSRELSAPSGGAAPWAPKEAARLGALSPSSASQSADSPSWGLAFPEQVTDIELALLDFIVLHAPAPPQPAGY
jgi:hypothetical protein